MKKWAYFLFFIFIRKCEHKTLTVSKVPYNIGSSKQPERKIAKLPTGSFYVKSKPKKYVEYGLEATITGCIKPLRGGNAENGQVFKLKILHII